MKRLLNGLGRYEAQAYAALRFVSGMLFAFRGVQTIIGWHARVPQPPVGSQMWIGGWIELIGGTLMAVGLFTRPAAFICSGMMAVAYFQFHWKFVTANGKWLPAVNNGELPVVYCFLFLFLATRGGGSYSIDARRR
ncbi:MAG TPA: DoxX family protein [Polyangiaceae bacterium]|nr:DoxX family protein [Polyangiaceae bacterium]